jgi:hypothetical protein
MYSLKINVNGKDLPLSDFPTQIILNILLGILTSLKNVDCIKTAVFELKSD